MTNRDRLREAIPAMLLHEGIWTGTYRYIGLDGQTIDEHRSRVECVFPDDGPWAYVQRNRFERENEAPVEIEFGGKLVDDRIVWDTDRFSGYGWQTEDNVVLLNLTRKDDPGVTFLESIVIAANGEQRFRTWHWFRDGAIYQRTLCDEARRS